MRRYAIATIALDAVGGVTHLDARSVEAVAKGGALIFRIGGQQEVGHDGRLGMHVALGRLQAL